MVSGVKLKSPVSNRISRMVTMSSPSTLGPLALNVSKGLDDKLSKLTLANRSDLAVHLHNKLAELRPARERSHNKFGRLINTLKMAETKYIQLDGIIFCGLLELLGESTEVTLDRRLTYLVPFKEAERMMGMLESDK